MIVRALVFALLCASIVQSVHAASYVREDTKYNWITPTTPTRLTTWLSGFGCPDTVGDDSISAPLDIGFVYRFGTATYTKLRVNTNGRLQFDNTRCTFGTQSVGPPRTYPDPMPDSDLDRTITGYRVDLDVSVSGAIEYGTSGTAPNRVFVVTWDNVPQWNTTDTSYRFQIQIHENGDFAVMYDTADDFQGTSTSSIGAGQFGYQLSTSDFLAYSAYPGAGKAYLYRSPTAAAQFRITHGTSGIYCLDHTVTVTAVNAAGDAVKSYAGTVNLSASTGRGTWVLVSGNGKLTDATSDDGLATYAWPSGEAEAVFALRYRQGPDTVSVDATDATVSAMTDDNTQGAVTFTPSGFTVTSAELASPHPTTIPAFVSPQTAGTNVAVHLTAYGQIPNDATCGVITTYTGNKSLRFWGTRSNPATGTIAPTVDGSAIATTEAAATAQTVAFSSGRASVTWKYKDVGVIALGVKDIATVNTLLPTGIRGTTGDVVFRPADLVVTSVTRPDGSANPAATAATGLPFVASGAPFTAVVQATDAEGSATPNFGLESPAETLRLASTLVLPVGGRNGTGNDGAIGNGTNFTRTGSGEYTGTTFYWDEVGVARLFASVADGDYLGSGALVGGSSGNVGRFYPSALVSIAAPALTSPCSTFLYMDHDALRVTFALEARNAQGTRTQNFDTTLLGLTGAGGPSLVAENADAGADIGFRLRNFAAIWVNGRATVDDLDVGFARAATVDGPFSTLTIAVRQQGDPDDLVIDGANTNAETTGNCAAAGNCDALALGTLAVYHGRAVLRPGIAAETAPLDMTLTTQRWNGTAFVANGADSCTALAASDATLSNFTGALEAGETTAIAPASASLLVGGTSIAGRHLRLSAPGAGNAGTARVTLDVDDFLQFDWGNDGVQRDPSATATFGHYRGHDRVVFRREVR